MPVHGILAPRPEFSADEVIGTDRWIVKHTAVVLVLRAVADGSSWGKRDWM